MPDLLAQALAQPGLGWLFAAALVAGVVRGFSGFGTAMAFMPVAGAILSPFAALIVHRSTVDARLAKTIAFVDREAARE